MDRGEGRSDGVPASGDGVFRVSDARVCDRTGNRHLPIGDDGFERAICRSVFVDKTLLVRDVLQGGTVNLFCRPRRFGKTLALTMLKTFFEDAPDRRSRGHLFEGLGIWDADGGRWREHQGAYPVIYLSMKDAKRDTYEEMLRAFAGMMAGEYQRHAYLLDGSALGEDERAYFRDVSRGDASEDRLAFSLANLSRYLYLHHGRRTVILIDEYDAPVAQARSGGFYRRAVDFIKAFLTGALKDGGRALAFSVLTGVQRISKESIFSDLNNLLVSTPLDARSEERFGFTPSEVDALATLLGQPGHLDELREWYDGYRFGGADIYNPWSVLNYFGSGCQPGPYWGNTSGNQVIGEAVARADDAMLGRLGRLLEPGGRVSAPLDMGVVFSDSTGSQDALWSLLYLAGYLTTDDTAVPTDPLELRSLRVPNREVALLFRREVVLRFARPAGGVGPLRELQAAVVSGDAARVQWGLRDALLGASYHDLEGENSYHMMLFGLLFDTDGYHNPLSNREEGDGRFDIRLVPRDATRPVVTVECKVLARSKVPQDEGALVTALREKAVEALTQVRARRYDAEASHCSAGALRYGIAFSGKRVAVALE